jgi:hypothetical protein
LCGRRRSRSLREAAHTAITPRRQQSLRDQSKRSQPMTKKTWTKPSIAQQPAGMEATAYLKPKF